MPGPKVRPALSCPRLAGSRDSVSAECPCVVLQGEPGYGMKGEKGEDGAPGSPVRDTQEHTAALLMLTMQLNMNSDGDALCLQGSHGPPGVPGSAGLVGLPGSKGEKVRILMTCQNRSLCMTVCS